MRRKATAQLRAQKEKTQKEVHKDVIPQTPQSANASPVSSSPMHPSRSGGAFARDAKAKATGVRASPLKRTRMRLINKVKDPGRPWSDPGMHTETAK